MIKSYIISFIKSVKIKPLFIIVCILILAGALRFYRIREYTTFLGDEGRDMLVVKRMIVDHKYTLLGPTTSVGSMYMGPVYYYLMTPFLWLWKLDPVGPSVMVALFALLTVFLIYKTNSDFTNKRVGLIAAFLYSISPLTIIYGRTSWNPNVVPFFTLLIVYSLLKIIIKKDRRFYIICGLSLGIAIQLHYITLLMVPVIFFSLLFSKLKLKPVNIVILIIGFIITYSPFLLFEIRHGFVNLNAVINFLFSNKGDFAFSINPFLSTVSDVSVRIFWRLVTVRSAEISKIIMLFSIIIIYKTIRKGLNQDWIKMIKVVFIWFICGIISYGFYHGVIYDYYLGSLFALPFIIVGLTSLFLYRMGKSGKFMTGLLLLSLTFFSFNKNPHYVGPNNMLKNTETIANFVYEKTDNKPYNFALITGQNSDHAYRYYLEIGGHPPIVIQNPVLDPDRKTVTNTLMVVCEDKICQPEGHPVWEIAGFGRAKVVGQWDVVTVKVFKLVQFKGDV
jgi:4-amino-4-deoxy-L-arabinose transferase-like glycosyltransferase